MIPEWKLGQSMRRSRSRLICGFSCPCCGPYTRARHVNSEIMTHAVAPRNANADPFAQRSLVLQAAAVDGSRDLPYVDTHVHLEMVLQKLRWYESASSLSETSWVRLTDDEQRCWKVLGCTPSMWDADCRTDSNPTWSKPWELISVAERSAAQALGWDAEKRDRSEWPLPTDVLWCALQESARTNLSILGETCDSWDEMFCFHRPAGYCAGGDMRRWAQLSSVEQHAALQLGFWPASWDMVEMADIYAYIRDFCGSGFDACIAQGCDTYSIDDCIKLTLAHPQVYAAFGCHPKSAWLYYEDHLEERFLAAFQSCGKKAIAWGEIGLDYSNPYYWDDQENRDTQMEVFERQLKLALERNLPLVLHIREAADDAFRLLRKCVPRDWKAHIHGYHGTSVFVESILGLFPNFYFGVTGTVSMGTDGDGVRIARLVPLDRMLLETDGPYMAPWGTVFNHVGQIPLIGRLVAKVRGCDAVEVMATARANSRYVYGV